MDCFSLIVLDNTLELATQTLKAKHVTEDVKVIRGYMDLIVVDPSNQEYAQKLQEAVTDLSEIAKENQQSMILARLETIARDLGNFR